MPRKIILYELNEVPLRIFDEYCRWRPQSAFAKNISKCHQYESFTEDEGMLSPWITWPTLHRGVVNQTHLIHDFGQDLTEVDREFPPIWKILASHGISTGVFGSLHTYPIPDDLQNYTFYLPDTFASGSECFPQDLSVFQEFNLRMARESPRNVSTKIPWSSALQFLYSAPGLGIKPKTFLDVGLQILSERTKQWKKCRRRTYQAVLAFDIFEKYLQKTKPEFSTFFTNHVASSMHRYWAARFPDEYESFNYNNDWVNTYAQEIEFTMSKADKFFERLVQFSDNNTEYQIWITTSMGQKATVAEPAETQLCIQDRDKFMSQLGLSVSDWDENPAMFPRYTFVINLNKVTQFRDRISKISILGKPIRIIKQDGARFFIELGQRNLQDKKECVTVDGISIPLTDIGLANMKIDDLSDTNAYHIPQGALFVYDPKKNSESSQRTTITTLNIAPSILKNFSVPVPEYMQAPKICV